MPKIPGHLGEQYRNSACACDSGEKEPATEEERQNCEPGMHGECQNRTDRVKRPNNNLHLPHERKHFADAAVDWKARVDPSFRATLDEDAIGTSGTLELLDGLARPWARLAKNVYGRAWLVPRENGFDLQFVKRDRFCARHMRAGIFWRRTDIQQLMGIARVVTGRERSGRDAFGLDFNHIDM